MQSLLRFSVLKTIFSCLLFFWSLSSVFGQTTVHGKIIDGETNEALPFVNVLFVGTPNGTTTDIDGNFSVSTALKTDSIAAFYLGYSRVVKPVKKNISQEINFVLRHKTNEIATVVIRPGDNPAHRILKNVIANKDKNDREKMDSYEYEVYNKIEFDLNDIPKELKKLRILRPVKFVFDDIDSTIANEKPQLPIMISEAISDYYYLSALPPIKKEIIKANKIAGMEQKSISQFMGDMYLDVNLYTNNILVFGKNFVSPISDNGLAYYHYYLMDSVNLSGHKCYQLQFVPRRKQELLFTGNMWITDTTWAVKRLQMKIVDDANINFINQLAVNQEYELADGHYMLVRDHLFTDMTMPTQKFGVYGRKTATYSNIRVNKPRPSSFYSRTHNLIVEDNLNKSDDFWKKNRPDTLSKNEQGIYQMMDTIQKLPMYKTWYDIVLMLVKGYKPAGNLELGPYSNVFSANPVEGGRIRLGARTSDMFSKWYELNGYSAFGLKDQLFKYSLGFRTYITKTPRQLVGINYKSDYELLGQSQNAFTQDNIFASLFRRTPIRNMTDVQQLEAYYEREWFTGFNSRLYFVNRTTTPLSDFKYLYLNKDGSVAVKDNIHTADVKLVTRFAWNEKYIDGTFSHIPTGTKYPILQIIYTKGFKNAFQSDYAYDKLAINVSDRIRINPIGYIDYVFQVGKVFGNVPYPLLELHGGNETYVFDPYSYNMMNYYEFVSDQYFTFQAQHHFDGLFLNHIPLMRKLKWREVISGKYLIGSVEQKNRDLMIFPKGLTSLNEGAYYEAGAGIENIFTFFRIDALWRLSYLDRPNIATFGLRGSMQFVF